MPAAAVIPAPIAYIKIVAVKKLVAGSFTLKKLECSKQACAMNTLAWNNNLGLLFYFVGF